jgi:hypothetical protein
LRNKRKERTLAALSSMKSPELKLFNTYTKNQKFNGTQLQNQYTQKNQESRLSNDFDSPPMLEEFESSNGKDKRKQG